MFKLRDLLFLLPDHELEGYPRSLPSEPASQFLAGWLSLWHPALIAAAQSIPRWHQAGQLPTELNESIFILPELSRDHCSSEDRERIVAAGSLLVEPQGSWRELQSKLLKHFGDPAQPELVEQFREEFAALGYAYLQIQLMTRQQRYTSNLDQLLFSEQVCKAVDAAYAGDGPRVAQMLQACFDSLGQERDHYYSLDVNLLDLTLLADSTLGKSLAEQLQSTDVTTLLASASLLQKLKHNKPNIFSLLGERLQAGSLGLAGGLDIERPHPLMPRESMSRDLARGHRAYVELGLPPPRVFGRLSFGMQSNSASLLKRWGYDGVLLSTFSGGTYPEGSQVKLSWESSDGTFLPALAAKVIDVADPAEFLALGLSVGEVLDHQHVPTLTFAHWPNAACDYFQLLKIIAQRTPAFGRWMLVDRYFVDTDQPYHQERLSATDFRMNWLAQTPSPAELLERTRRVHELQAAARGLQNMLNLDWQLTHYREVVSSLVSNGDEQTITKVSALGTEKWAGELSAIHDQIDGLFDPHLDFRATVSAVKKQLEVGKRQVLESLCKRLDRPQESQPPGTGGKLIFNPVSCPMRALVHTEAELGFDTAHEWCFASGRAGNDRVSCIDVPSMGFVFAPLTARAKSDGSKQPVIATAGGLLQNEFMEVQVDAARGHMKSLHVPARRGNRLSMMLAYRERDSKAGFQFSEMIASDVRMLTSSSMCGILRASGRMEKDGVRLGRFEIDYELWRGSRNLDVRLRLSELQPLKESNPWKTAYTVRIAWPSESAILRIFSAGDQSVWAGGRAVSPELIEIDETDYKTHILTGGMAFHRRTEERFLEIILGDGTQDNISHHFGIGVDLPSPVLAARRFLSPHAELTVPQPIHASSGWLVSVDVRSVAVDLEAPLVNEQGDLVGVRLFVAEHSGKSTTAKIRLLREVAAAHRVDYLGNRMSKLTVDQDQVTIGLRANEQVNVDVLWAVQ